MPGVAPAQGVGPEEGRSPFPRVFRSGLGGPAGAPQHGGGCLLSCVHSSVPASPGNTTPAAAPEVTSPPAGHAGTLLNTALPPREGQRRLHRPARALHLDCPVPAPALPLFTNLTPCCWASSSRIPVSGQGPGLTERGARQAEVPWAPREPPRPRLLKEETPWDGGLALASFRTTAGATG